MRLEIGNFLYFVAIILSVGGFIGLYFLLRKRSKRTVIITLISLMVFALVLHFLKGYFPPYSENYVIHLRDSWFINICGANILLFPIFLVLKNKYLKDYMFYIGLISGLIAICYPADPAAKLNQAHEWLDIARYYLHHNLLWYCPLLMVLLKIHTLDYHRVIATPVIFMLVMLFIMMNQVLQAELGFISWEREDIHHIIYVNNSLLWGPNEQFGIISKTFEFLCPSLFKTIPVGPNAGETKYWPWFWLLVPCFLIITPLCFGISMIFEHKHLKEDVKKLINYFKTKKRKGNE